MDEPAIKRRLLAEETAIPTGVPILSGKVKTEVIAGEPSRPCSRRIWWEAESATQALTAPISKAAAAGLPVNAIGAGGVALEAIQSCAATSAPPDANRTRSAWA